MTLTVKGKMTTREASAPSPSLLDGGERDETLLTRAVPGSRLPRRAVPRGSLLGGSLLGGSLLGGAVLASTLLGCGAETLGECGDGEPCPAEGQVQVATWWGTRAELFVPFDILKQSLRRRSRLEATLAHRLDTKVEHTDWVDAQLDPGNPAPAALDVISANNGDEVLRWTPCAAAGDAPEVPRLVGLTRPEFGQSGLKHEWIAGHFPPEVMETLQCHGETYALPVGIHRINTLIYSKGLFRAAGYAVDGGSTGTPLPTTLEELHAAAAALEQHLPEDTSASDLAPSVFAVSGREPWTLSLLMIENLMLALARDEVHYETYWQGFGCDEALLERTLSEFVRLARWFGNFNLLASDALDRVRSGQAAMTVMGDWAAAEASPDEIGTIPFPGTGQYFVFSADVFALPDIPSADPWKGLAWLRAVTGDETQLQFSAAKSALPARVELEGALAPGKPDSPRWVRSLPAFLPYHPDAAFVQLQDRLEGFLYAKESQASVLEYARNEYPKLAQRSCEARDDIK